MNRRITNYMAVHNLFCDELSTLVSQYLQDGWQPYGFLQVSGSNKIQAMVKYEERFID